MRPSSTASVTPPADAYAIVGTRWVAASITERPQPSFSDGHRCNQDDASTRCLVSSSTQPSSSTRWPSRSARTRSRRSSAAQPCPTTTSRRSGQRSRNRCSTVSAWSTRLCGTSRLTTQSVGTAARSASTASGGSVALCTTRTSPRRTPSETSSVRVESDTVTYWQPR